MLERDNRVDILKGFGIVLVVLGHLPINGYIKSWIYLFHMPLFFFLSGYLHKNRTTFSQFVGNKARTLLWPYFVWGSIYICFETSLAVFQNQMNRVFLRKQLLALVYGNYIWDRNDIYIGVLWFLLALFWVSCAYELMCRFISGERKKLVISCALSALGFGICIVCKIIQIRLPFCGDIALTGMLFYSFGAYSRKHPKRSFGPQIESTDKQIAKCMVGGAFEILVGSGIGVLNCLILKKTAGLIRLDMLTMTFGNELLYVVAALLIIKGFWDCVSIGNDRSWLVSLLIPIGQNSLLIMILHLKVLTVLSVLQNIYQLHVGNVLLFLADLFISFELALIVKKKLHALVRL